VDEVQLLVLLVGGIRVVVLADEAIAGIPSGVGVDTERGDPEVIADRPPLRIAVSVIGVWDVGQRGVRSGHLHGVDATSRSRRAAAVGAVLTQCGDHRRADERSAVASTLEQA
jgi:hypothetical protein